MTQRVVSQLEHSLEKIKKRWPKPLSKDISNLFDQAHKSLTVLKEKKVVHKEAAAKHTFDFVKMIQQVLKAQDIVFLNRHLSYHVVATSDLPKVYGAEEEALTVLSELLATTARHSSFGSRLSIHIQGVESREGPAVQTRLNYEGKALSDLDRQRLLEELYGHPAEDGSSSPMADAKNILRHVGGQFWLEFPKETQVSLVFNWPAFGRAPVPIPSGFGTYKYDIWITDYNKIRQSFGIDPARKLIIQIESFVRSLVRHPIDIVIGFPDRGTITAIYESQEGGASSVASRISQKLSKEPFRIGRKGIVPKFRYQLTFLT